MQLRTNREYFLLFLFLAFLAAQPSVDVGEELPVEQQLVTIFHNSTDVALLGGVVHKFELFRCDTYIRNTAMNRAHKYLPASGP
jgi:hypothetical protein